MFTSISKLAKYVKSKNCAVLKILELMSSYICKFFIHKNIWLSFDEAAKITSLENNLLYNGICFMVLVLRELLENWLLIIKPCI